MTWRCDNCESIYETNDPPCESCGNESLVPASSPSVVDTGDSFVWACAECGREHVKHSPPCSRCGHPTLERTRQDFEDVEADLAVPSWFEVAKPFAPIIVALVVVVGLFATGIVPLSVLPGIGAESPPDAPGDGDEWRGIDLEVAAVEVHERFDAERTVSRSFDDGLTTFAEYTNRAGVANRYGDETHGEIDASDFDVPCEAQPNVFSTQSSVSTIDTDGTDEFAADVAELLLDSAWGDYITYSEVTVEGIDLHIVDERLYVVLTDC